MSYLIYFALAPELPTRAPDHLHYQDAKNELHVSPHLRLCGHSAMAHIATQELAERFAEACAPIFQKRYGNEAAVRVVRWEATKSARLEARIKKDTEIIQKRLETGNWSPNKAP